jgi:hypothetical protein
VLKNRTPVMLTKPMEKPSARRAPAPEGEIACDELLFARLRADRHKHRQLRWQEARLVAAQAAGSAGVGCDMDMVT